MSDSNGCALQIAFLIIIVLIGILTFNFEGRIATLEKLHGIELARNEEAPK